MEVDIIAIVRILQLVGHHPESHDLLPDEGVGPGDVHLHLRIVDLVGQPIVHDLRQVSARWRERHGSGDIAMTSEAHLLCCLTQEAT